jgi:hypothetical protein
MYSVTYQVEQARLAEFMKAADPYGTMKRCHQATEQFEVSQREFAALAQDAEDVIGRFRMLLESLYERFEAAKVQ